MLLNGRQRVDIASPYTTAISIDIMPETLQELHTVSVQALSTDGINSSLTHASLSSSSQLTTSLPLTSKNARPVRDANVINKEKKRLVSQ